MSDLIGNVEFGRTYSEKFGYLLITGIFIFVFTMMFRVLILVMNPDMNQTFYEKYDLFYSVIGAAIGFVVSQIYIRIHKKSQRGGVI